MAALVALSACAPGDWGLTDADIASRARGITFSESDVRPVPQNVAVPYDLSCLDGTRITAGTARVVGVTGLPGRLADYSVAPAVETGSNRVVAVVRYTGPAYQGPAPRVAVEMQATCVGPQTVG